MPWDADDVSGKSKLAASSPKKSRMWTAIANKALDSGASDASAIRQASGTVKKYQRKQPAKVRGEKGVPK